jgi:catechol 2,3-dioxygenase-like lactoylglutathione lyase family enzyme
MPVVHVSDPAAARELYVGFLGFRVAMEEDGLLMLASQSVPTTQLIVAWESASAMDPDVLSLDVSIEVEDVDEAYAEASRRGLDIVRELRDEPWGIRRFFLRDPSSGRTLNIASHIT